MDWLQSWAEKQRERLRPTLALMETGQMHTRELRDGQFEDSTRKTIEQFRDLIAELDSIAVGRVILSEQQHTLLHRRKW
ncbi:MAG: hypothetical protein K2X49_28035 [Acetobacteraceae bacterium]|nr:hypothetical protein [Acetobacteraceae bacterium]